MTSTRQGASKTDFALACLALAVLGTSHAGVIRHDRDPALYTALASDPLYSSVGDMIIDGNERCSGTLIASNWVLTAAHCVDGSIGGLNFTLGGTTYTGKDWITHEEWDGDLTSGVDIALVELATEISGVTIADLYTGDLELGEIGTSVGFGRSGTGSTGDTIGSGTKRAGNNIIDTTSASIGGSDNILLQDFDNPLDANDNVYGDFLALDLEYLIAPGDSGGGLFISVDDHAYLAGVHSFTGAFDGLVDSDYGDFAGSTRVSGFIDWIRGKTNLVPEPGSLALLAGGILLLGRRRRRKSRRPTP